MPGQEWAPPGIDTTKPNVARVYDYHLGGKDNFAVDRAVAEQTLRMVPEANAVGQANRAFLRRSVRYMVKQAGIRQFLDIGSGLPTQGNVHEIAQECDPRARVVYVDNDPVVLVHARALLASSPGVGVITADLRDPSGILASAVVRKCLDLSQPAGLLMFSILHHINDDEDPEAITAQLRDALAPGSHMAISHFCDPGSERPEDSVLARACEKQFSESFGTGRWRTKPEILAYFGDWEVLDPGLGPLPWWRPDVMGQQRLPGAFHRVACAVARKREEPAA
jgi:SAM-dependent methyltransferase